LMKPMLISLRPWARKGISISPSTCGWGEGKLGRGKGGSVRIRRGTHRQREYGLKRGVRGSPTYTHARTRHTGHPIHSHSCPSPRPTPL
jgi:hypothetical protein